MTNQPAAAQVTEDYRAKPPSVTPPERVRVALVAGSGSVATDDLHGLLRRRLLILTSIVACGFFAGLGVDLLLRAVTALPPKHVPTLYEWAVWNWRSMLNLVIAGGSAVVLWRRPPRSVPGLRRIEVLVIGTMTVLALMLAVHSIPYGLLERAPHQPAEVREAFEAWYVMAGSLIWFMLITTYGTLIPNTWRRCAAVTGVMAASPIALIALHAFWLRPLAPDVAVPVLLVHGFYNGVAVAVAVFSSSRIEILRRQAAEARILGQYVLREQLGAGGMGEVYRAEHVLLRRPCALKVIRPERAGDPKNLRRFEREVQVTATLTHPNTIQIYDYGHAEDGTFYYVMEYLPGQNLEQLVKQHGPLPPERAVHILRQVCGALREAHAAGLIHRDIKPSNVIVCERGGMSDVAKLLDFGIVDAPEAAPGSELTIQGQVLGTPAYMSAEQAAGMPDVDARSDLYSLGATAYFMVTGKAPFERVTPNLVIAAHLRDPVTPPHFLRTEIPADLSAVIQRCLEKDPAGRYADAAGLEKALAECQCAGRGTEERPVQVNRVQGTSEGDQAIKTAELERRWGF